MHPDSIHNFELWRELGSTVCIENMDSRKKTGRTAQELSGIFNQLPEAMFCLDVAHARQFDSSMVEAYFMLSRFAERLVQVHISEVNTASRHIPLSEASVSAYSRLSSFIPQQAALIFESRLDDNASPCRLEAEIEKARNAFHWLPLRRRREAMQLAH
uniref:Xylose isomerase-like TIM barrel domain-containing protein n=1 Tax=Paracidobacterium acidisoli TaxID=2303751 RepID=A0A372IMT5_9BACT